MPDGVSMSDGTHFAGWANGASRIRPGKAWRTRVVGIALLAVAACNAEPGATSASTPHAASAAPTPRAYNLTLLGYNYTDYEISSFEVDGQGGGNLEVSEGVNGGGGRVCCVAVYAPMARAHPVQIKWNPIGEKWCEATVMLRPPLPPKPENFEVHFYRDGQIEVAVSEGIGSDARVQLTAKHRNSRHMDAHQNVDNSSSFARCRIGYR